MAERIKMLFGFWTQVRQRSHVLHRVQMPLCKGQF